MRRRYPAGYQQAHPAGSNPDWYPLVLVVLVAIVILSVVLLGVPNGLPS